VSPRTAFGQYGGINSGLTVGVTQPACLHSDVANSPELPITSRQRLSYTRNLGLRLELVKICVAVYTILQIIEPLHDEDTMIHVYCM